MNFEIEYRVLASGDREIYRQLRLDCLRDNPDYFGTTYEEEEQGEVLRYDNALKATDTKDFLYGAFHKGILIGICGFTQERRMKSSHRGEIHQMYVKPAYTGQGIGTKLLQVTLDKAFKDHLLEHVILGVVNTNEKALNIYRKFGFVQYGHFQNYFKNRDKYWAFVFMALTKEAYLKQAR